MNRFLLLVLFLFGLSSQAQAQEYCVEKYNGAITNVSAELGGIVKRQAIVDKRLSEIYLRSS